MQKTFAPHQERVIEERAELGDKLNRLIAFLSTPTFQALPSEEQALMHEQMFAMQRYVNVMDRRIVRF